MKTLTSLMLIELAKTDRAMSWAYKHNRYDLYEDIFNIRLGVISDFKDYKVPTDRQFINQINWCAKHNLY